MKDILQDVVAHTHALGFLSLVKVNGEDTTTIESMAEDRSVILTATTQSKVADGTFGMPNLDKLALHLKNQNIKKMQRLMLSIKNATVKMFRHTFILKTLQVISRMIIVL